jgi:hypothetical protein
LSLLLQLLLQQAVLRTTKQTKRKEAEEKKSKSCWPQDLAHYSVNF